MREINANLCEKEYVTRNHILSLRSVLTSLINILQVKKTVIARGLVPLFGFKWSLLPFLDLGTFFSLARASETPKWQCNHLQGAHLSARGPASRPSRHGTSEFRPPRTLRRHLLPGDQAPIHQVVEVKPHRVVGEARLLRDLLEIHESPTPQGPQNTVIKRVHSELE